LAKFKSAIYNVYSLWLVQVVGPTNCPYLTVGPTRAFNNNRANEQTQAVVV